MIFVLGILLLAALVFIGFDFKKIRDLQDTIVEQDMDISKLALKLNKEWDGPIEVTTYWSEEIGWNWLDPLRPELGGSEQHEQAVLLYDRTDGHSHPADAVNAVKSKLYNQGYLPWEYTWWDDDGNQKGLLISPVMDLERNEVDYICEEIINEESINNTGEWETTSVTYNA